MTNQPQSIRRQVKRQPSGAQGLIRGWTAQEALQP